MTPTPEGEAAPAPAETGTTNEVKAATLYPPGGPPQPNDPKPEPEKPVETPPAETPPAETPAPEPEKAAAEKVPDGDYAVNGLPEGMSVDQKALARFQPLAKKWGITQAQFDELVPEYPKMREDMIAEYEQARALADAEAKKGWETQARTEKDIGGQRFTTEVVPMANKMIQQFGDAEFKELVDGSGLARHRSFLRFLTKAGKHMELNESGGDVRGAIARQQSVADLLYPTAVRR